MRLTRTGIRLRNLVITGVLALAFAVGAGTADWCWYGKC
jgi:hypothetical protein